MRFLHGERLIFVIAVLIVAAFFFSTSLWKIIKPEKTTTFITKNNYEVVPEEFPKELLFDLEEVKNSQITDYKNSGKITAKQYEVTFTSSRPFNELVLAVEGFFIVNNFSSIYKEETGDGGVQIRRAVKQGKESLVIQIQKLNAKTSEVRIIYTK